MRAAKSGSWEVVKTLVDAGAPVDVEKKWPAGQTALWEAARAGHLPVVQFLVERGADVKRRVSAGTLGPPDVAAALSSPRERRLTLERQPTRVKDKDGSTPFLAARKRLHVARFLHDRGADLDTQDRKVGEVFSDFDKD